MTQTEQEKDEEWHPEGNITDMGVSFAAQRGGGGS